MKVYTIPEFITELPEGCVVTLSISHPNHSPFAVLTLTDRDDLTLTHQDLEAIRLADELTSALGV